jgi:hypothetical protein
LILETRGGQIYGLSPELAGQVVPEPGDLNEHWTGPSGW